MILLEAIREMPEGELAHLIAYLLTEFACNMHGFSDEEAKVFRMLVMPANLQEITRKLREPVPDGTEPLMERIKRMLTE